MAPTAVPHTTNGHVDIYNPIYHPILPHRHRNIDPSISTSNAHFRRLYDVYHTSLQRGNIPQAKRAYALLVRSKQFDWAANWRNGLDMVQLPFEDDNNGTSVDASLGNRDGHLNLDDPNTTAMADDDDLAELQARKKRLLQLKVDYLRECHIIHSRKAKKKYSLREVSGKDTTDQELMSTVNVLADICFLNVGLLVAISRLCPTIAGRNSASTSSPPCNGE